MPKSRRDIPPESKQGTIVEAACDLFTSLGYDATSMVAVATQAGVAPNTIYWYFANKDALLVAALERLLAEVQSQYLRLEGRPFGERVNWLVDRFYQFSDLVGSIHGRLAISEPVRAWHDSFHRRAANFFVGRLQAQGVDPAHGQAIVAIGCFLLEGLAMHHADGESRAVAIRMLEEAIDSAAGHPECQQMAAPSVT